MSLVQHVSSLEGVDHDPDAGIDEDFTPIARKISYDVLQAPSHTVPVDEQLPATAAYEVPVVKRLAQVAFTILACWVASGIVFGFAALKPILVEEEVYHNQCTEDELQAGVELCVQQDLSLNLFFTIASITANVSALPVGTILDHYGSRICGLIGCVLLALGSLFMSLSFLLRRFHGLIAGNFFLAFGGTFIFVPSFQIANAFPRHAGTIVALVTGAFDASAAVFLLYRFAYEASGHTFTPDKFFLSYLAVPVLITLALLSFMPKRDYYSTLGLETEIERAEDATRDVHESDDEIESESQLQRVRGKRAESRQKTFYDINEALGGSEERQQRAKREENRHQVSQVWGVLHGMPAHRQMATPWFILITLMTIIQMLRMNYFIATVQAQYEYMLGSVEDGERINNFFDIALPVAGVLFTPFIGGLLDRLSVPAMLSLIVVFTTIIGVLNSIPAIWAGYMTVLLFVLLRPLYYSAMSCVLTLLFALLRFTNWQFSDYATKVFGFATFGRVYGTIICVSGLVNFSQYGLDTLTHGPFGGNPIPINSALAIAGFLIGVVLVGFVTVAGRRLRADVVNDDEREPLLLERDEDEDE
ncbi:uncharacterized protein N7482_010683 [Penicillium canariense]|uniref:MFS transporter n=1 Tax=Penicillium canariense TaxID=189055 RepID=A0A9W9LD63_9EURO|nr:uncharacterized protein N7482_010683 [Penicillium canariense]KAJ5151431.1 hypothetical protein N7482_010683 [Penicillium canariense]